MPRKLRPVAPDERATPRKLSVTEAATNGTHQELLVALRDRIAKTVQDVNCSPRDLGTLARQLVLISTELG